MTPAFATGNSPDPDAPAAVPRTGLMARLNALWAGAPAAANTPTTHRQRRYADIGQFLFEHGLDLTPLNFGCIHDYLAGTDRQLVEDIDTALRQRSMTNGWIEDYVARRQHHAIAPETMIDLAAKVESELNRCLLVMKRSTEQASGYSESLSEVAADESPEAMIARLAGLTREMIGQTRLAEVEMRASYSQVSQLRTTLRSARKASEIDHLTGLPNRRGFERRVGELCAGHTGRPLAIAICDVDHFKAVNDRFGHDTGDRVLKLIARELRTIKRDGGDVARLGGEEFAVLLPNHDAERAAATMNRVRERMSARKLIDNDTKTLIGMVTFSAGIAIIDSHADLKRAMRLADSALYAAKHAGRNRIYAALGEGQLMRMPT